MDPLEQARAAVDGSATARLMAVIPDDLRDDPAVAEYVARIAQAMDDVTAAWQPGGLPFDTELRVLGEFCDRPDDWWDSL